MTDILFVVGIACTLVLLFSVGMVATATWKDDFARRRTLKKLILATGLCILITVVFAWHSDIGMQGTAWVGED